MEKMGSGSTSTATSEIFDTPVLILGALLCASGIPPVESYINKQNKVVFRFPSSEKQAKLVSEYLVGDPKVSPTVFIRSYNFLKSEIFRLREGE